MLEKEVPKNSFQILKEHFTFSAKVADAFYEWVRCEPERDRSIYPIEAEQFEG